DVVFGLADQVRCHVGGVGGVVGEDGDLGRPCLGVDADDAFEEAFGGGDPDVSGAGHHADGGALARTVREHGGGLGTAHGVHLVYAEQGTGRQDGGVRQSTEFGLRRGGHGEGGHPGFLGGHDVHDHAGG